MKTSTLPYDGKFFEQITDGSLQSARAVAPLVLDLYPLGSVVDIGCGQGAWLRAHENGVGNLHGFDGGYVDRGKFLIDPGCFSEIDLSTACQIPGTYDLALCLEVAEHLPARAGARLVQLLTQAAPVVLFSAAIPGQGGAHHVNEQWPCYWESLFAKQGFIRLDPIRRRIFANKGVAFWYRQNIFMYVTAEILGQSEVLQREKQWVDCLDLDFIHPAMLGRITSVRGLLSQLVRAVCQALKNRIRID